MVTILWKILDSKMKFFLLLLILPEMWQSSLNLNTWKQTFELRYQFPEYANAPNL